jgi:hypothetical protein
MLGQSGRDTRFRLYLLSLSLLGLGFVLVATSKYGAGVSSDAARNLSTADSLLQGRGFVDMVGAPLILWPPLYPMILAGLSQLSALGTFQVAWYLNALLCAANIWLGGWLLYRIFPSKPSLAGVGAMILLLSRSSLRIHANVASEPLFETLMLLFFLVAPAYLGRGSRSALWAVCLLAGMAALQRYLGVALMAVAAALVFRRENAAGLLRRAVPLLASAVPLIAWVLFHNYPTSGTPFGPRELGAMLPLENMSLSLTKMIWWFIPRLTYLDWLVLRPWIPMAGLAAVLIAISRRTAWLSWLRALAGDHVWPALLFSSLYFVLLAFTVVTADHLDLTSDRYYVVILPIALAFLLIAADTLILCHLNLSSRVASYGLAAMLVLWFVYPLYSLQAYLRQAIEQGEPTNYNIANSANFREMTVVKAAQGILNRDPGALVYSNYLNIVWFIYRHPVETLPFEDANLPRDQRLSALSQNYANWPAQGGYVIWFTPNQYHHIAAPDELATIADLELLFKDKTGQIYVLRKHQ